MDDSPKPISSIGWMISLALIVLVVAGFGMFRFLKFNEIVERDIRGVKKLTLDEKLDLLKLRDRALGYLENQEFAEAEPLLQEIIQRLPDDPFGSRNLTICRELTVEKLDPSRHADKIPGAIKSAREAVEQLILVEPGSYVPHVLAARIALKENKPDQAAAELRRAAQISPKSAAVWYDLFLLTPISPGEAPPKETVEALRKVRELEPDNLFVLKDWLPLQAQLKEPGLAETAVQAAITLEPFVDVIKVNLRGLDIRDMLTKLSKAVADGQWPTAASTAMILRNVIVSESARDERYVHRNSLEYLLPDFAPSFYEGVALPEQGEVSKPISFPSRKSPLPTGALDLACIDLDLDGTLDGVAVLAAKVEVVLSLATASNKTISFEIGDGFQKLLAVDLDDDVDLTLKDRPKDVAGCPLADPDLIVFGTGGVKLFENFRSNESPEFREKPLSDALKSVRDVHAIIPGDLDLDGDLDFITVASTGVQMWSNRGNWTFDEITARSKLPAADFAPTAAVAVDWDRDTDLDFLVSGKQGFGLLENMRHGRFRWRSLDGDFEKLKNASSLLVEQLGGRPSWSVIGAAPGGLNVVVTETSVAGVVSSKGVVQVTDSPTTKVDSLDFDNDGWRDLIVFNGTQLKLWRGLPNGKFEAFAIDSVSELKQVTTGTIGDLDHDGDEDLLLAVSGDATESIWLANEGGNTGGWLNVALTAIQIKSNEQNYSKRVNHVGIGSIIEIKSGSRYQAQVIRGPNTHFGIGSQKKADALRILWTNGIPQNFVSPSANQWICEEQKLHGSCPYLYTWDGEKFVFFTDLLWNAPLGLKFAEDVIAPWREWEYLKIDGDKLQPKDGQYQLRVTAELWEIEYFDEIKLFAVDHPANTQIFTNEKVGPAAMAEHKIHTVSKPQVPVAARDTHGRDILNQVITRDGVFTRTYDRKLAQGLTTEHFLELDLGDWSKLSVSRETPGQASKPPVVTLYLTGWMYPGSTSLSVQHSQNPDQARQRPPSLQAVDANGQWREVRPFLGFPGGKTKTIAIDISDVFAPDATDHRLRIVTNMEFYWDAAFFTVDDQPVEFRQTELPLVSASLRDRGGVSLRAWPETGNGPELFDYQKLVPGDMWPPIAGAFTRFGDVRPLLADRDDHLVVMHPGDEIQLSFTAPSDPLPAGWVRDFVIYNVGWDKDCDQNTVYGDTAEPLPFRAMTAYPHRDGEARPMDDDYVRYLKTYQTRTRSRAPFWNDIQRR